MKLDDEEAKSVSSARRGGSRKLDSVAKYGIRQFIDHAVCRVFEVKHCDLRRDSRGRANVAFARQVAMYLAHVSCGLSLTDVGALFERDRTTVAYACGAVEDRRDDAILDRILDLLDRSIRHSLTIGISANADTLSSGALAAYPSETQFREVIECTR